MLTAEEVPEARTNADIRVFTVMAFGWFPTYSGTSLVEMSFRKTANVTSLNGDLKVPQAK